MRKFNRESSISTVTMLMAGVVLAMSLTGCIRREVPDTSSGGGSTPGGAACSNLPASTATYKGGDALGEELTLSVNPATLAYTITINTGDQRSVGTVLSGGLTQLLDCHYASNEAGAVFTFGANGFVQGGVQKVGGASFTPLLAFSTTYNNAAAPTVFNDIALTLNAAGVQTTAGVTTSYGGSARIRNAGTMQFCSDTINNGFVLNSTTCAGTERGYFVYNSTRNAFDYFVTTGSTLVTTGGTLAGSMIVGQIGDPVTGVKVLLFLRRVSATDYGMRLMALQATLASGTADSSKYQVVDSSGSGSSATLSGSSFTRGTATATLTYDSPVVGVIAAAGVLNGHLIYSSGVYGFVPSAAGGAAFEMGLQEP